MFFQRHGSDLHMFSVSVAEKYQGRGYAARALSRFIDHARTIPGVNRVRLGAKGHRAVEHICEKIEASPEVYGLRVCGNRFYGLRN